ncbi:ABC transporter ATP-binding protein [Kaistia dalseonensis]|uniref:Spermidine/putrescine import ATP-binding protein PotA n=1 Tax=Kaistia dalseonensis TaxID=410840 RepID=A0ABU0H3B0_9HYPH|nr:ABC transporter ATP-binding protein [Kaistia dalseonensis]MCX5494209.1 ABC transporter ATP-binding protein [Kaistia dalseonensis]MDQ0436788.1 putative spermidine/putrescine transport system ATP-binding protein [Kaistia dalseonensis]
MAFLSIEKLVKTFGTQTTVKGVDLAVERGEFVTLLGPSGCGKTTILRMVAGFETATSGTIRIDGKDVTDLKPNQRNIGMVFQAYALFPNMSVADNIAFGLKVAKKSSAEIAARVKEMLELIKLPQLGERYPYQLSGGQQQRVALARALAVKPQILLLDEPLSALDAKIRISLRDEIRAVQRSLGITTIFVTHDQEEALSMSDRICVMNEGHIEQLGTPFEVYNYPTTRFVASFVGTLNIVNGKVADSATGKLLVDGQEIVTSRSLNGASTGDALSLALRPEALTMGRANGLSNNLDGTIDEVHFLGSVVRIRVKFKDSAISLDTFNKPHLPPPERGQPVTVNFGREDILVLDGAPN